jgi:hypothetical protein
VRIGDDPAGLRTGEDRVPARASAPGPRLTLIPWALGSAVAVGLAGAFLAERLGRATLHLGLAAAGLLTLGWTIAHGQDTLTSWTLAPALLITGFGSGLVFIPVFDYVLGDATAEEVGTGSGVLNAVQQFANATGAATLGTVFFARAGHGGFFSAGELVTTLAAALYLGTFLLVGLLPRHAQQAVH